MSRLEREIKTLIVEQATARIEPDGQETTLVRARLLDDENRVITRIIDVPVRKGDSLTTFVYSMKCRRDRYQEIMKGLR